MSDLKAMLERADRAVADVPLPAGGLEGLERRRDRKRRNQRIQAGVLGVAVAVAVGWLGLSAGRAAPPVPADPPTVAPGPADLAQFVGSWNSTELQYEGSSQTMTIQEAEDGVLRLSLHDDSSGLCSDRQTRVHDVDTPSTMIAQGRLVDATTLVAPSPVLTCVDGREPMPTYGYAEEGAFNHGPNYTLVLDPATGRLFDSLGESWHRGPPPLAVGDETTERIGPGRYSFIGGDVTLQAVEPWSDHAEAYIDDRLFFLLGEDEAEFLMIANPTPLSEDPCDSDLLPAPAEAVVQDVRSNPDLEATEPVADSVGGFAALRLDVTPRPGASRCVGEGVPVVAGSRDWGTLAPGESGRLYILDLPGGSARALAILISAPEANFEQAVQATAPVLDSFEFHSG